MSGSNIAGGKLSTTYQLLSSKTCAAVDLPAPDIPVIITTSTTPPHVRFMDLPENFKSQS